jgi:2,5-diketo-D-gluconate reductase B
LVNVSILSLASPVRERSGGAPLVYAGDACVRAAHDALAIGCRHIDTAQIYGNETEVGRGLSEWGSRARTRVRDDEPLAELTRKAVPTTFEKSLQRLATDYVDLLLIHWPNPDARISKRTSAFLISICATTSSSESRRSLVS